MWGGNGGSVGSGVGVGGGGGRVTKMFKTRGKKGSQVGGTHDPTPHPFLRPCKNIILYSIVLYYIILTLWHYYIICLPPIYTIKRILNRESITSIHSNHCTDCRNTMNSILSFIYNS